MLSEKSLIVTGGKERPAPASWSIDELKLVASPAPGGEVKCPALWLILPKSGIHL